MRKWPHFLKTVVLSIIILFLCRAPKQRLGGEAIITASNRKYWPILLWTICDFVHKMPASTTGWPQAPLYNLKYFSPVVGFGELEEERSFTSNWTSLRLAPFNLKPSIVTVRELHTLTSSRIPSQGPPLPGGVCRRDRNLCRRQSDCAYSCQWAGSSEMPSGDWSSFAYWAG